MTSRLGFLAACAALLFIAACSDSPTEPDQQLPTAPYSQTDLVVGTGEEAVTGKTLTMHYTLWIFDPERPESKGTQIETSVGRTPFTFTLGVNPVIQGWLQGIPGMRVGGKRRLIIPPALAYGASGNGPIPPNATLVFDVELIGVQ